MIHEFYIYDYMAISTFRLNSFHTICYCRIRTDNPANRFFNMEVHQSEIYPWIYLQDIFNDLSTWLDLAFKA